MKKKKKMHTFSRTAISALLCLSTATVGMGSLTVNAEDANNGMAKYYTDFATYAEEQAAAYELNEQMAEEGIVLLKNNTVTNKSNTLPFGSEVRNISVFGRGGAGPAYGGAGSGAGQASAYQTQISLTDGLEHAGFNVNKELENLYLSNATYSTMEGTLCNDLGYRSAGTAGHSYDDRTEAEVMTDLKEDVKPVESTFSLYNDAALIVLRRDGMEGFDHSYTHYNDDKGSGGGQTRPGDDEMHTDENGYADQHSLMLTPEERALIAYVKEQNFKNIVVMLNTGNPMEAGDLQDDEDIGAILWIGMPGISGFDAVGKVLTGEVNPSGHLSDIWAADFTQDPTWYNSAYQWQGGSTATGDMWVYDTTAEKYEKLSAWYTVGDGGSGTAAFIKYEESIYMGYKWYETAAAIEGYYDDTALPANESDAYYNRNNGVVYPFGYGLSYTDFAWSDLEVESTSAADGVITASITVTNTGDVAGKDVVQVYVNPPYKSGIQKATANLVAFEKTKLLKPGESQTLELEFAVRDMASYDYNDANENGFKGYELEAGDYAINFGKNSHETVLSETFTLGSDIRYDGSTEALNYNKGYGSNAENLFSNGDLFDTVGPDDVVDYITRESFSLPDFSVADAESGTYTAVFAELVSGSGVNGVYTATDTCTNPLNDPTFDANNPVTSYIQYLTMFPNENADDCVNTAMDVYGMPWYVSSVPESWTQAQSGASASRELSITLDDLYGVDYKMPVVTCNNATKTATPSVDLNDAGTKLWEDFMNQLTYDEMVGLLTANGLPVAGYTQYSAADGPAQLSKGNGTFWLAEVMIASTWNVELAEKQGIMVGNESLFLGVTGWWGPGANIHRSPFGGRNFEYYSQDGVHAGKFLAAVSKGATSKGTIVNTKHYFLNDQENSRMSNDGPATFCTEQAMREIYLKPFEIAVKEGGLNGFMASYNRVGIVSMDNNYMGLYALPRGEWGFDGVIVSDGGGALNGDFCIRNGLSQGLSGRSDVLVSAAYSWSDAKKSAVVTETDEVSFTQWYNVRKTAQNLLYNAISSNTSKNGIDTSSFTDQSFEATKGVAFSATLAENVTGASKLTCEITSGELPDGISLSGCKLSGTPTEKGVYTVTVTLYADNYVTDTAEITIEVGTPFTIDGSLAVQTGDDVDVNVSLMESLAADVPEDATVTYTLTNAPSWLSIEEGIIYGEAQSGEYTFTVNYTATYVFKPVPAVSINRTVSYSDVITLTVSEDPTTTVEYQLDLLRKQVELLENYDDTDIKSVIAELKAAVEELKGSDNASVQDSIKALEERIAVLETNSGSGCASSFEWKYGVIGSVVVLAVVAVTVCVKKREE